MHGASSNFREVHCGSILLETLETTGLKQLSSIGTLYFENRRQVCVHRV